MCCAGGGDPGIGQWCTGDGGGSICPILCVNPLMYCLMHVQENQ